MKEERIVQEKESLFDRVEELVETSVDIGELGPHRDI